MTHAVALAKEPIKNNIMKLIQPAFEIWQQENLPFSLSQSEQSPEIRHQILASIFKHIERCGRICYLSHSDITDQSAQEFVQRMINSKHFSVLEHGTIYLAIPYEQLDEATLQKTYGKNIWCSCCLDEAKTHWYITTNYRVMLENQWLDAVEKYLCMPTAKHHLRVSVHLTTNRQVTHELVRARLMSFSQESTRYCNYSKDKFNNELTFVEPLQQSDIALQTLQHIEQSYVRLTMQDGWTAQEAAAILPNTLKAEIVVSGFIKDWSYLFDLRVKGTTGKPHPMMVKTLEPVYEEFVKRGLVEK